MMAGLHPFAGETTLDYTGPKPPFAQLDGGKTYSWVKAPRWRGHPMETGPLARLVMLHAAGNIAAKALTAETLAARPAVRGDLFDLRPHPGARASRASCWSTAWRAGTTS
jgi:hydrogenase large subunit